MFDPRIPPTFINCRIDIEPRDDSKRIVTILKDKIRL